MLAGPIAVAAPPVAVVLIVAVMVVALTMVTPVKVMPVVGAATWSVVPVAVKPVPVRVTAVGVPRRPKLGLIEARVGVPGATTVNVTGLVVAAGVVTVTFRAVRAAVVEMVNVALT